MRHRKAGRKLGREPSHRRAMFSNMVTSLFLHGRIRTTEARAKELRRIAERVITLGKSAPDAALVGLEGEALASAKARRLHCVRRARLWVKDREALSRVFGEYASRFQDRPGGYTRVLKLAPRAGDNADMAIIELVEAMGAGLHPEVVEQATQGAMEATPAQEG